jgi:diguanylate cyclase (GGDEF)-like protein
MNLHSSTDDLFRFSEDEPDDGVLSASQPWRILVIDDDADVHQATRFSLDGFELFSRPLELLHAFSALEARRLLSDATDIAVVLLDVVMETPDAGLSLIDFIRNTRQMTQTRIVLRTGQPGYAPEHETLLKYDINDYKTKSELTHHKLLTTITTTVRAYQQLCLIEASRKGLEQIIEASGELLHADGVYKFASGVITQVASLLGTRPEGVVCAQGEPQTGYRVLAAAGRFARWVDQPLDELSETHVAQLLKQALLEGKSQFACHATVLFLGQREGVNMAAYVESDAPIDPVDMQLLLVFCSNLTACLENLMLVQQLQQVAYEDPLLKLPNRSRLVEHLNRHQARGQQDQMLVIVDVDDFASINDLMGHDYGDKVLVALADRLAQLAGPESLLARVSGNAFGLLGNADVLDPVRVLAAFESPILVAGHPQRIALTMGLCGADGSDTDGADWLKNANIALKQAKRERRGRFVRFTREMAMHARNRAQLLSELHTAFDRDRLTLAFQPQLDLASGRLMGLEALLRWRTDDGRFIPPDRFIPVAEQSGLIVSLGDWVMKTAFLTMRELINRRLAPDRMAVNVSVVQFQAPGFIDRLMGAMAAAQLEPRHIELEITESVSLLGQGVIESLLQSLRAMGISVAIDDFGTGYSSLSYLEKLPLDRIKIDKSFVTPMSDQSDGRIAELIVQLGLKLGLRVLAEGIEDAQAWKKLRNLGVHEGQGYHIARPMEMGALMDWLSQHPNTTVPYL